jgi:hypothetical protein
MKYYFGNEIKENEMRGTHSIHERSEKCVQTSVRKVKGGGKFEYLSIYGMKILNFDLKEIECLAQGRAH